MRVKEDNDLRTENSRYRLLLGKYEKFEMDDLKVSVVTRRFTVPYLQSGYSTLRHSRRK